MGRYMSKLHFVMVQDLSHRPKHRLNDVLPSGRKAVRLHCRFARDRRDIASGMRTEPLHLYIAKTQKVFTPYGVRGGDGEGGYRGSCADCRWSDGLTSSRSSACTAP